MKKGIQLIIFAVLLVIVIFVWTSLGKPKRSKATEISPGSEGMTSQVQGASFWGNKSVKKRKVSEFKLWGRSPFNLPRGVNTLSGLNLMGIIWDDISPQAIINDTVVGISDSIEGSKVIDIKRDRVILSDGKSTVELRLWEEKEE